MGPLEWSDIWAPPFTANMPHSSHAALAPSSSSQTNVQPSPPSCLKLYLYFLSFGWHQWQALSDETNILTDANTKTYFSNPKKSFRLLSPSGDLGIGLAWDNLYPPADLKFVKKFTRPNFRPKEFYTLKTRKLRLFLPAIKQFKCIIISNLVLFG